MSTTTVAPTGIRAAKREQAAARKAAAPKAPAKKAPAKPAAKAPASDAPGKLRWALDGERGPTGVAQHTEDANGDTYKITGQDKEWKATYQPKGGKPTILAEGAHTKCYNACVKHHRGDAK
jgi:hypothetical protein